MDTHPPLTRGADSGSGHLWLREHVLGGRLRFRLGDRGLVFGGETTVFEPWGEPLGVATAVRAVRAAFDTAAFAGEVTDPGGYTFYGVATRDEGIAYDWDRLPAFLGTGIRRPDGDLLAVDAGHAAFDRLGLAPLNVFERERPARDFQPDRYTVSASAWYDGPAAGTRVRQKNGPEALVEGPVERAAGGGLDAEAFLARYVTDDAVDAATTGLADPSVETARDRLLARLVRRHGNDLDGDESRLRDAAVEPVARRL